MKHPAARLEAIVERDASCPPAGYSRVGGTGIAEVVWVSRRSAIQPGNSNEEVLPFGDAAVDFRGNVVACGTSSSLRKEVVENPRPVGRRIILKNSPRYRANPFRR